MKQYIQSLLLKFVNLWVLNDGESPLRSLVKAYSYRVCGTLTTVVISYVVTGEIVVSLAIGATEMIIKPFVYWCHERVWNKIKWAKSPIICKTKT
jgi:uncharacterized membrane protein